MCRVTQSVTQHPGCEAQDGPDSLIWLVELRGLEPDLFHAMEARYQLRQSPLRGRVSPSTGLTDPTFQADRPANPKHQSV